MSVWQTYLSYVRMPSSHRGELLSVQWLRGLAVLMVLVYHVEDALRLFPGFGTFETLWVHLGYSAPDLFFVISGFIMCYVTFGMKFEPKRWLVSRFIRIYPLYMAFTFLAFLVWTVNPAMTMGAGEQTPETIVKSFLIVPQAGLPLVFVGWTVEHEIVFYFLVFVVATLGGKSRALINMIGGLSVLASLRWLLKDTYPILDFWDFHFLSLFMVQFLIGALVFQHMDRLKRWGSLKPALFALTLFIFGGFACESGTINHENLPRVVVFGLVYGLLLLAGINYELRRRETLGEAHYQQARPFMVKVGDASYSLYLLHPFALSAGGKILKFAGTSGSIAAVTVSLLGVATLYAGLWFYALVEKPFLQMMKKLTSRKIS
jgi:exopolysaccharide production protein ExoZ